MNELYKKAAVAVAGAGLLLNTAIPVFAAVNLTISGNGDSENDIDVNMDQSTGVNQTNEALVTNQVTVNTDTGNNSAERNTGGNVDIDTGDADSSVNVQNTLNTNSADVDCCQAGDVEAKISGNGDNSDNDIDLDINQKVENEANTGVTQYNQAMVENSIRVTGNTGGNSAGRNTGGNVDISTGDINSDPSSGVSVTNTLNANSARIGGGSSGMSLSARITGNGSDSDNDVNLNWDSTALIAQTNHALVGNTVNVTGKTGDNSADRNTGGDVTIDTGDADADVSVDTMANFNWADINCGCLLEDVVADIRGNGDGSDNDINASFLGGSFAEQVNRAASGGFFNTLGVNAYTGTNSVERSTGDPGSDPSITTGDSFVSTSVENAGNSNVYGDGPSIDWPDFGSTHVSFSFDLAAFWAFLGLS